MSIERIEAIPFRIPIRAEIGALQSHIWPMSAALHVLVKVIDSDGVVGYGEATPRATIYGDTQTSTVAVIRDWFAPALKGLEPWAFEASWQRMDKIMHNNTAKAAIDQAIHDLLGKRLGVNVRQLLGGTGQDRCPLGMMVSLGAPEQIAAQVVEGVSQGIQHFKIKVGVDPERDIATIKAVRRAVGHNVSVAIDMNQGYSVATAIRVINLLQEEGIRWAEEPVKAWDVEGKRRVAQSTSVPLLMDESVFTPQEAMQQIRSGACGLISIKANRTGFTRSKAIATIAEANNISCVIGSARETALGTLASAYFASQCNTIIASEIGDHVIFEASLLTQWPRLEDGYLILPTGPGLGIEIDQEQVEHYRIDR